MRRILILAVATTLVGGPSSAFAQELAERPRAALAIWDTGTSSAEMLASDAIAQKRGWKQVAGIDTSTVFQGDAAITNGRILAIARKQGTGLDLYSLGSGKPEFRARLLLATGGSIERVALSENSRAAVGLEITSKAGSV